MILSKRIHRLFNVLATLLLTFSTLIGGAGAVISASAVNGITGLSAGDAKVTDSSGKDVTSWGNLNKFSDYNVHYNWSIPDGTPVNNGDTATFTLPNNVQVPTNQQINVLDQNGQVAGVAKINAGSRMGTITFNDDLANKLNRHGTLVIGVTGTENITTNNSNTPTTGTSTSGQTVPGVIDTTINKVGWYDHDNSNLIHWDIVGNLHNSKLQNPTITDTMGAGMKLVPGSVKVQEGYYVNGAFTGAIDVPSSVVETNGQTITVKVPSTDLAIHVSYETEIIDKNQSSYNNAANLTASNATTTGHDTASLPGTMHGTASYDEAGLAVKKVDAQTGKTLSGAKFALFSAKHEVIGTAVSGKDGVANFAKLESGTYYLKEVSAPAGYELNTKEFTVNVPKTNNMINVTVKDNKETTTSSSSSSSSNKSSSSSSVSEKSSSSITKVSSSSSNVKNSSSSKESSSTPSSKASSASSSSKKSSSSSEQSSSSITKVSSLSENSSSVSSDKKSSKSSSAVVVSSSSEQNSSSSKKNSSSSSAVKVSSSNTNINSSISTIVVSQSSKTNNVVPVAFGSSEQGVVIGEKTSSKKSNHGLFDKFLPNTGNVVDWALVAVGIVIIGGTMVVANKKWTK